MIDHFGINVSSMADSAAFYDAVLATLGHTRQMDFGVAIGYGTNQPQFWISTGEGLGPNRESHIAFTAESAADVRRWFDAAVELGAVYYGAFVRDPDGNNVEAVCHTAADGD